MAHKQSTIHWRNACIALSALLAACGEAPAEQTEEGPAEITDTADDASSFMLRENEATAARAPSGPCPRDKMCGWLDPQRRNRLISAVSSRLVRYQQVVLGAHDQNELSSVENRTTFPVCLYNKMGELVRVEAGQYIADMRNADGRGHSFDDSVVWMRRCYEAVP